MDVDQRNTVADITDAARPSNQKSPSSMPSVPVLAPPFDKSVGVGLLLPHENDTARASTHLRQDANRTSQEFTPLASLSGLPTVLVSLVGEFLLYREALRLARSSKQMKPQLKTVAVWDCVPMSKLVRRSSVVGKFKRVEVCDIKEMAHLPTSLTSLTFGDRFNQSIDELPLPSSLTNLELGFRFDHPVTGLKLPESLTSLSFGYWFDQPIADLTLPPSLMRLTFGCGFNQSIAQLNLPPSLTSLTFGDYFDHPISDLKLPASLRSLTFGDFFNQPVCDLRLPSSLTSLRFGHSFKQPVDGLKLPLTLTHLEIADNSGRSII